MRAASQWGLQHPKRQVFGRRRTSVDPKGPSLAGEPLPWWGGSLAVEGPCPDQKAPTKPVSWPKASTTSWLGPGLPPFQSS